MTSERAERVGAALFFAVCAAVHVWASAQGWSHTILDQHGFRQTQTAISAYWLLRGGPWLAYETPVLGPPWSIPFEFPLYQWMVAAVVGATAMPLDQAGRLVSVVSFYAALPAAYRLLGCFGVRRDHRLLLLGLWLVSPEYLFWSRTFMIESTALCVGLWYAAAVAGACERRSGWMLALTTGCGVLGMTVKMTTMPPLFLLAAMVVARQWFRGSLRMRSLGAIGACGFAAPVVAGALWSQWTDGQRAMNPVAATFLLASQLTTWSFGSPGIRSSGEFWSVMLWRTVPDAVGHWCCLAVGAAVLCWTRRRWREALACAALFLSAPMVFANLHFVHNYYPYANALFAVGFVGFAALSLVEGGGWGRAAGVALLLGAAVAQVGAYAGGYLVAQRMNVQVPIAEAVRRMTEPSDVVLIYGADWTSVLPYYAERRALMDRADRPFTDPVMRAALTNLRPDRVGAAVLCGHAAVQGGLIGQAVEAFGFDRTPVARIGVGPQSWCDVYGRGKSGAG